MSKQIITIARSSGRCPPSLLPSDEEVTEGDKFITKISNVNHISEFSLRNDIDISNEFEAALKMTLVDAMPNDMDETIIEKTLAQRRCIILGMIGATQKDSKVLKHILDAGFLAYVKYWLDDILKGKIGGVDLLLHLLSNIIMLPVTKEMVTASKLGKQVSSVEKHNICVGNKNEDAIKQRVGKVKEEWSKSVKKMKKTKKDGGPEAIVPSSKRIASPDRSPPVAKKAKSESQETFSLSNLLNKKALNDNVTVANGSTAGTEYKSDEVSIIPLNKVLTDSGAFEVNELSEETKKKHKHIKWADVDTKQDQVNNIPKDIPEESINEEVSWTDRKKRDRLREKELLQQARKAKLMEKDDSLDSMVMMFSCWHTPVPQPRDNENPSIQVASKEVSVQVRRMASVLPANYLSEELVPVNPTPLSDIEQALDMTSQSSSIPDILPFFVPPTQHAPAPSPMPIQAPTVVAPAAVSVTSVPVQQVVPPAAVASSVASVEVVQSLGLPLFLVGQSVQALKTLAASPGLLNAFIDANGVYDQVRILNLVQTLTQNLLPAAQPVVHAPVALGTTSFQQQGQPRQYSAIQTTSLQSHPQSLGYVTSHGIQTQVHSKVGYRGDQNLLDGNLHLSGYGPMTTPESIIALFAPYVKVDEIVPKNGFMFVNTSNPQGAKRAREALNGVLLGGQPLRINVALRRNKTSTNDVNNFAAIKSNLRPARTEPVPLPRNVLGQIDYESVRDDRGNPATKNLFVAGYGQEATEHDLRDLFNQHTQVTGVVMKGSFCFVNTAEKMSAVHSREALTGAVVKGGVLRINFAKESGRLGTSFDQAYNASSSTSQPQRNYYGHNY